MSAAVTYSLEIYVRLRNAWSCKLRSTRKRLSRQEKVRIVGSITLREYKRQMSEFKDRNWVRFQLDENVDYTHANSMSPGNDGRYVAHRLQFWFLCPFTY